jgi:hypothetical protein
MRQEPITPYTSIFLLPWTMTCDRRVLIDLKILVFTDVPLMIPCSFAAVLLYILIQCFSVVCCGVVINVSDVQG